MRRLLSLFVLLLASSHNLAAQVEVVGLQPGTRVRVSAPAVSAKPMSGGVAFMDSDSIVLTQDGDRRTTLPLSAVRRLEVSRGRDRWAGAFRGAGIGGLAGGAAFAGLMVLQDGVVDGWTYLAFIAGGVIGVPAGFIVGGLTGVERWDERTVAPNLSLFVPRGGGFGLQASIRR